MESTRMGIPHVETATEPTEMAFHAINQDIMDIYQHGGLY
jgi:hypothetical protein